MEKKYLDKTGLTTYNNAINKKLNELNKANIKQFKPATEFSDGLIVVNAVRNDNTNIEAIDIYNNLDGKYPNAALSAKQGKVLNDTINNIVNNLQKTINDAILEADKKKHPVGDLEFNVSGINPADYLGFGTWELWGSGKVPVGIDLSDSDFNSVEKVGGSKTHTLTVNEMPSHRHQVRTNQTPGGYAAAVQGTWGTAYSSIDNNLLLDTGGGQPHSIMQPYITCYMWKRVA